MLTGSRGDSAPFTKNAPGYTESSPMSKVNFCLDSWFWHHLTRIWSTTSHGAASQDREWLRNRTTEVRFPGQAELRLHNQHSVQTVSEADQCSLPRWENPPRRERDVTSSGQRLISFTSIPLIRLYGIMLGNWDNFNIVLPSWRRDNLKNQKSQKYQNDEDMRKVKCGTPDLTLSSAKERNGMKPLWYMINDLWDTKQPKFTLRSNFALQAFTQNT